MATLRLRIKEARVRQCAIQTNVRSEIEGVINARRYYDGRRKVKIIITFP